jgi:rhodanese-related sulfurtransferase
MTLPGTAPQAVMERLRAGSGEWAFLDLREAGEAAEEHPFASVNLPYGQLEMRIAALVPRQGVEVALFDGGDGVAERAGRRLSAAGWRNLSVVVGGAPAWKAAGLPLFKGEHSFSKAFGEWVEHAFAVPEIGPDALADELAGDTPPMLVDGRPYAEHRAFSLPGAVNCPNAELGLRLPGVVRAGRTVVVHCAGRTRSIIGAQTVRDFGLADRVLALRDGTQGWELSGRARDTAADRPVPQADETAAAAGMARARQVMTRLGVPGVDAATLRRWVADPARTTFLFDPRPEGEGPLPAGFRPAPGTTLVQQTDRFIGVRGARVVLWDPLLVRAVFAALWLRRMGIEAHVLTQTPPTLPEVQDRPAFDMPPIITAGHLARARDQGVTMLDLRPAAEFRANHVAGARRALRPRLDRIGLRPGAPVALISGNPVAAAAVAADLREAGIPLIGMNLDTPDAWRAAGLPMESELQENPGRDIDVVRFCAGRHRGNLDDARAYLAWETGLLDRLSTAGLHFWPELTLANSKTAGA